MSESASATPADSPSDSGTTPDHAGEHRRRRRTWKALVAVGAVAVLTALLVNAVVCDRAEHAAEPFGGGRIVDLGGRSLNVREYGSGGDRAVVLLHGYSASIQWWDSVGPALAAGGRVIAIDLIGHGGSEAPRDADRYTAEAQAAAVRGVLDVLGVRHAAVVGHSMGGAVATALAEAAPDLIERVVVADTVGAPGLSAMPVLSKAVCWPVIGPALDRLRGLDIVDKGALQSGFAADFPVPDIAYRSLQRMTHTAVCAAKMASPRFNEARPVADRLAKLGKPVLVLWGERDVLTPTGPNVERYRAAGLDPVVIAGAGHSVMLEKPADFISAVATFVHGGER